MGIEVSLFIYLLVIGIVVGVLFWALSVLLIPEPLKGWIKIIMMVLGAIVFALWLLSLVDGGGSFHPFHLR